MNRQQGKTKKLKQEAYENAIDSLAIYKFIMFGYWVATRELQRKEAK